MNVIRFETHKTKQKQQTTRFPQPLHPSFFLSLLPSFLPLPSSILSSLFNSALSLLLPLFPALPSFPSLSLWVAATGMPWMIQSDLRGDGLLFSSSPELGCLSTFDAQEPSRLAGSEDLHHLQPGCFGSCSTFHVHTEMNFNLPLA